MSHFEKKKFNLFLQGETSYLGYICATAFELYHGAKTS